MMSQHDTITAPRSTFKAQLHAALKIDIIPTVLWGMVTILTVMIAPTLVGWILNQVGVGQAIDTLRSTAPANTVGAGFVVLAIVGMAEAGPGRRESVIGGWTRADRLRLCATFGAGLAVLAGLVWVLLVLGQPWFERLLNASLPVTDATYVLPEIVASPIAAFLVALSVFTAAFVPAMYVRLAGVHWTAVVGGSIVLVILMQAITVAYFRYAVPTDELMAGIAGASWLWLLAAVLLAAAYILWVVWMSRRASIRRYRA